MRTIDEINKELLVQNGDGVRRLQLEVLMDVRALLQTLVANSTSAVAKPAQPQATTTATTQKKK
jgi:hypothetical protein